MWSTRKKKQVYKQPEKEVEYQKEKKRRRERKRGVEEVKKQEEQREAGTRGLSKCSKTIGLLSRTNRSSPSILPQTLKPCSGCCCDLAICSTTQPKHSQSLRSRSTSHAAGHTEPRQKHGNKDEYKKRERQRRVGISEICTYR